MDSLLLIQHSEKWTTLSDWMASYVLAEKTHFSTAPTTISQRRIVQLATGLESPASMMFQVRLKHQNEELVHGQLRKYQNIANLQEIALFMLQSRDCYFRGILVELVLCVLLGHPNSKIANSMKLVTFAFFSSQYHVFELKNIRGNLIAPNNLLLKIGVHFEVLLQYKS